MQIASRPIQPLGLFPDNPKPRLYDHFVEILRVRRYSRRTERAYVGWIRRFILFHRPRHPRELSEADANRFLTHLAVGERVAASTQNQALAAILFLYDKVLEQPLDRIKGVVRARRSKRLPVVLTRQEVAQILRELKDVYQTIGLLLYGSGLRMLECLRLRVKDVDVDRRELTVRQGKGDKDRRTMLPESAVASLHAQIAGVRRQHERDLARGFGTVELPDALDRKLSAAASEFRWQYVFPSTTIGTDPRSGVRRRHHLHESAVGRAISAAVRRTDITQRVSAHTFRHTFATHLIEAGYDIRTVQELLGHKDVRTTMIYTHVLNKGGLGVQSPADFLTAPHDNALRVNMQSTQDKQ